jgi:hypothetical protein
MNRNRSFKRYSLWMGTLMSIVLPCAFAQTAGSIRGTVRSAAGQPLKGAIVEVISAKTAQKFEVATDDKGIFQIGQLPPDQYRAFASAEDYSPFGKSLELGVGQSRTLDFELNPASEGSVIAVANSATTLDFSSARLGVNISGDEVMGVPLNGKNYSLLTLAAPGANTTGIGSFDQLRFNGKSAEQNKFTFDGIDASAVFDAAPGWLQVSGSQFRLQNSVETTQEFRVDTGLVSAESGTGVGGQINLISRSGGNEFHGSVFEYLRNDKTSARDFFDSDRKSKLRMNQFGANAGGAILKDRLFFFASYESLRQRSGINVIETVPSASARSRAVPEVAALLAAFPQGRSATGNPDIDTAERSAVSVLDETNFGGRLDYNLSTSHRLFVRYLKDIGDLDAPDYTVTPRRIAATSKPDNGVITLNSTFDAHTFNELKFGVNRAPMTLNVSSGFPLLEGVSINVSGSVVQPGINGGAPSGVASPGGITRQTSSGNGRGSDYRGKSYSLIDNFGWARGAHSFKAGFETRWIRVPINQLGGLTYSYGNLNSFLSNTGATISYIGDLGFRESMQNYYIGFIQDEIRLRSGLVANFGLRYEYYTVNRERNNRVKLFDAGQLKLLPNEHPFYQADKAAFAPRVSLAWAPKGLSGKTVVRLGGGVFYGPGQFEDLIQPIESDVNRFSLSGQRFPVNIAQLASSATTVQTPRGYDVSGYRVPEKNIQYGLSIQQALPMKFVGQVGYVGSLGRNLFLRSIANQIVSVNPATGATTRQNPEFGEIDYKTSGGRDTYNAMQASLSRRFVDELTFGMQYAWSHSIGNSQGSNESFTAQNPNCFNCERSSNSADIRHYLNMSSFYRLPLGKGRPYLNTGKFAYALSNWSLGGMLNARTGLPINVLLSRTDVVNVDASGRVISTSGAPVNGAVALINTPGGGASRSARRPDLVSGVSPYLKIRNGMQWLNPAAFAIPAVGTYGNLGRNALRGPGSYQFDFNFARKFALGDRANLEFRCDVFNLLNHASFSSPPANLPNALPTLQPGSPFNASTAPGFGVISSTIGRSVGLGTARQMDFSLRLNF